MVKPVRKTSNKNPPILSHEFIIQNHADIVSCVAMVFVTGLMIQATAPFASVFITLHHNVTEAGEIPLFSPGYKDWACVFFYSLICIVIHAIIQEYVLDKISKKLHLSKAKLAIFNTSGQLLSFYLISVVWGFDILLKERIIPDVTRLWSDYPPAMFFMFKMFVIIHLAYSLHELPELYFTKVKKEEQPAKALHSVAVLTLIAVPYFLNFNRLLVCLLVLHHTAELFNHISLLIQTVDKDEKYTKATRLVSNVLQFVARLGSIILSTLTLWYGLALRDNQVLDISNGLFNVSAVRVTVLAGMLLLQMYLIFGVISAEKARAKEDAYATTALNKAKKEKKDKPKKAKKNEDSDLPEVDQNTNKTLRKQKVK